MSEEISTAQDKQPCKLPWLQDLVLEVPLYQGIDVSGCDSYQLPQLENRPEAVDVFCIMCNRLSVFNKKSLTLSLGAPSIGGGYRPADPRRNREFSVELLCSRNNEHIILLYFLIQDYQLIKVGQYPSLADLHAHGIGKYRKILGQERYAEFARAVGMFAHGIGIGAFVYLRRIFESLVGEAHSRASKSPSWDQDEFDRARMSDRVTMLRGHLPEGLVVHADIYGVLSKGIHSLTEDECRTYFPVIKSGIELILDDEIARMERERKTKLVTSAVAKIKGVLRGREGGSEAQE